MTTEVQRRSIPKGYRTERSLRMARAFIFRAGIRWLPVRPHLFYEQFGWILLSNAQASVLSGRVDPLSIEERGEDARTFLKDGHFITVYNETRAGNEARSGVERLRWTLAHEIGHIVLGHLTEFTETGTKPSEMTEAKYRILEREADIFAAEVLAPMAVLEALRAWDPEDIAKACWLSKQAAENRHKDMDWHSAHPVYHERDEALRAHFNVYLAQVAVCLDPEDAPVRKISRNPEVAKTGQKYDYVPLDEKGRFTVCPRCGNTVFSDGARYCRMCGLYLFNECSNQQGEWSSYCGKLNPGDARFCEHCGSQTLLMSLGLLKTWEEVVEVYQEIAAGLDPDSVGKVRSAKDVPT